jgi:hypothetical protein
MPDIWTSTRTSPTDAHLFLRAHRPRQGDVTLELDRDQRIDGETKKLLDPLNDFVKDRAD